MRRLSLTFALALSAFANLALAAPVDGRYEAPCALEPTGSRLEAWVFAGDVGRFFHQVSHYDDDACTSHVSTDAPAGNFTTASLGDGTFALDLQFVVPAGLAPLYTRFELEGDVLYLGLVDAGANGTTPAQRPTAIDRSAAFVHVP